MRRENRYSCLINALIAACISFFGIACMVTGFAQVLGTVNLWNLGLFCAGFSLAASVCFTYRQKGWLLGGTIVALLGTWMSGWLQPSVESLLYRISVLYDKGYHWGTADWVQPKNMTASPELGLCLLAGIVIAVLCWTLSQRKRTVLGVLAGFLPLFSCIVLTDTVPQEWCLMLLLASQLLAVMTGSVRRISARQGNRLTALLLAPVLLASMLLFYLVPKDSYTAGMDPWQWLQQFSFIQQLTGGGNSLTQLDLRTVGPKEMPTYRVMEVSASTPGNLYLRGQAMDSYDGKLWKTSALSTGEDSGWPSSSLVQLDTVSIRTITPEPMLYFPYSPKGGAWDGQLQNGMLENPKGMRAYSFQQVKRVWINDGLWSSTYPGLVVTRMHLDEAMAEQCLQLPEETKRKAREILNGIRYETSAVSDKAQAIGRYVQNSAKYDLNTKNMPGSEEDFAMWFLKSSDTGYCVHFATAATVLLRAEGIPARYVSGYVASVPNSGKTTVTADRAHAWVEYFDPLTGWTVLDPTPVTFKAQPEEEIQPSEEQTEPTEPVTTEPTVPSETTEPIQRPSQTQTQTTPEGGEPSEPARDRGILRILLYSLAAAVLVCSAAWGQSALRKKLRRRTMKTGTVNRQALAAWKEGLRMSRILKAQPPQELEALAEKARFSQHKLTQEEHGAFTDYVKECSQAIREMPLIKRIWIRLFWAV